MQLQQCTDSQALILLAQECLQQSLGCERAAVILLSEDAKSHQSLGFTPWMQDAGFTGSRTFIRQCLEQRSTLAVGSLADDKGLAHQQSVIRFNIQAALAMPLMVNDNIVGVLYADSTQDKRFFTQIDIAFAQKLADLLSLRLLYHNIEHRINMLDKTRSALSPVAMH
ncbi:GAF domain-containing protein [Salinimonas marina]|uniref:GAF domain-containing protein n=1 Tax=Salinimonas marina TaxID=2785918 RepID=UPI001E2E6C1D|nr:GAF domain-containing protein [Salinimonas marina]